MSANDEILDSIEILIQKHLSKSTAIYTGMVVDDAANNLCNVKVNGEIYKNVRYYGSTPLANYIAPVFVPFGNMSNAFILSFDTRGGSTPPVPITELTIGLSPLDGVSYTNGIDSLDFEFLHKCAAVISNNNNISQSTYAIYVDYGDVHRRVSIGDQSAVKINGVDRTFRIIGFNTDNLGDKLYYNNVSTTTNKVGITCGLVDSLGKSYIHSTQSIRPVGDPSQYWAGCHMRLTTLRDMFNTIDKDQQTYIAPMSKKNTYGDTPTIDRICLYSVNELGNNGYYWYAYLSSRAVGYEYWTRDYSNTQYYRTIDASGNISSERAYTRLDIVAHFGI